MDKPRTSLADDNHPDAGGSDDSILPLIEWLTRRGARCSRYGVRRVDGGEREAFARQAVRAGDLLLAIPSHAMITDALAHNSDIGRRIAASGVQLRSKQSILAAFLLQEKVRADSLFRPYLDTLPNSFPRVPLFFQNDELSLLSGSLTQLLIQHRKASLAEEYQNLCDRVEGFGRFTPQQFIWARIVVITRSFGFSMDRRDAEGLVPLADMLNHHPTRETKWVYDGKKKRFVVSALRDYAVGETIHGYYGSKCNSRLFVNYGFALDNNDDNEAEIVVAIASDDPLRQAKLALLGIPGGLRRFQVPSNFQHKAVGQLLSFVRVACADEQQLARMPAVMAIAGSIPPIDAPLEARALERVAEATDRALGRFETTVAQDDALLDDPNLSTNARTCVIVRRGEKRVLESLTRLCRTASAVLSMPREHWDESARQSPAIGLSEILSKVPGKPY